MRRNQVNRRSFLQAVAGASAMLPLLEAGRAEAQAEAAPRLVIYQTGQGNLSTWTPPVLPGNALELSTMLQPLAPHQEKVMALSGVSNLVSRLHLSDGHTANTKTLLTANVMDTTESGAFSATVEAHPSQMAMGPSIDHYLAARLGVQTPLNLSIGPTDSFAAMNHQAEQNANGTHAVAPLLGDPREVFQSYFAGQSTNTETTRADRFRQNRGSVLQGVSGAFGALRKRLGRRDQQRIEQHLDAIGDLESELGFVPPANCGEVTVDFPAGYETPSWPDFNNMEATADLMTTLATQALACGAKQCVTIHDTLSHAPSFDFLGMGAVDGWHAHVHNDPALGLGYGSSAENPILQAGFRYYAEVFNNLLAKMDAITEPNGGTLLDNSIVVWISELGAGTNHYATDLPIVIAGGGGGRIAMNRHVACPEGTSTNDFYLSLLHAFGVMDSTFGHTGAAGINNGPIAALLA